MAYFASEMQAHWRQAPASMMFDRYCLRNELESARYGRTTWVDYRSILETCINNTGAALVGGCPMIRCSMAGGGAHMVTYNTYVAGGAGAGTSTAGCFLNFAGISALMTEDIMAGNMPNNRSLFILFPTMSVAPVVGTVLTQAVTGATGTVLSSSLVYGYVQIRDLLTGTWNQTNNVTNAGGALVPAICVPRGLAYATSLAGNADSNATNAGVWVVVRGYTPAFVQGDNTGTGWNGDIADCTPLTWNDNVIALVAANYHTLVDGPGNATDTIDVLANPDNVIAHAMQAAGDNSADEPEIIMIYVRADEPLVYTENACQGVNPSRAQ